MTVGGRLAEKLARLIRPGGILASVLLPPPVAPEGSSVTAVPIIVVFDEARLTRYAEGVAAGRYKVPIARRMKLSEAAAAHRLFDAGGVGGKILLIPG